MQYDPTHYVTACLTYCYNNNRLQNLLEFIAMIEAGRSSEELFHYGNKQGWSIRTIGLYENKYRALIKEMKRNRYKEQQTEIKE